MTTATLWDTAVQVGHLAWHCRQLCSLFGTWARDDHTPQLARMFATMSNHHAELAMACNARLPTVAVGGGNSWKPQQFVVAPDLPSEQALLRSAAESGVAARRKIAERELTAARRRALELAALVDDVLDEPTVDLLGTLLARFDADLAILSAVPLEPGASA